MPIHTQATPGLNAAYRAVMKRNSVYIAFVLGGALLGERVVEYGFNTMWEKNNQGKLYKHLEGTVIGGGGSSGEDEE